MALKCPSCGFENIRGEDRCVQCFHSLMQTDLPKPKKVDAFQRVMMTAPISDLVTGQDLLVAEPEDTIEKIVKIFQKEKKHCTLVYKKKHIVGILSKRDILFKVAGKVKDLSKVTVQSVMTSNPECVQSDAPIAFVLNQMAVGGFRHVPVLAEDETPLGIIMIKDLLEHLTKVTQAASS